MGLSEQEHVSPGLTNATTDAEGEFIVHDCLVVRQREEMELVGNLQLFLERFGVHPDAHRCQLVASLCHRVPDKNIPIEAMHGSAVPGHRLGDPVIVIGRSHFVRVAVLEYPADPVDKDRRVFLQDLCLPLLAQQVGIPLKDLFGMEECEVLWQVRIPICLQLREERLHMGLGPLEDRPDLLHDFRQKR